MKISELNLVKKESEITPETFIVIIGITIWTPDYPGGDRNVFVFENKKYIICNMKGTYKNIVKQSAEYLKDKWFKEKFKIPKNIKLFVGGLLNGYFEGLMYSSMQSLINENLVFSYPHRVDFNIDDETIIKAIKENSKFNPPSLN